MTNKLPLMLLSATIGITVLLNFGFAISAVKEFGFTSADAEAVVHQKSPVTIEESAALSGMAKVRVGQSTDGASRVTVGKTSRSVFMAASDSAVGPRSNKGVAMYKTASTHELVDYKFISVGTNSATVSVELGGEFYSFGVDCESRGDCKIFAFAYSIPMATKPASRLL